MSDPTHHSPDSPKNTPKPMGVTTLLKKAKQSGEDIDTVLNHVSAALDLLRQKVEASTHRTYGWKGGVNANAEQLVGEAVSKILKYVQNQEGVPDDMFDTASLERFFMQNVWQAFVGNWRRFRSKKTLVQRQIEANDATTESDQVELLAANESAKQLIRLILDGLSDLKRRSRENWRALILTLDTQNDLAKRRDAKNSDVRERAIEEVAQAIRGGSNQDIRSRVSTALFTLAKELGIKTPRKPYVRKSKEPGCSRRRSQDLRERSKIAEVQAPGPLAAQEKSGVHGAPRSGSDVPQNLPKNRSATSA